MGGCVMDNDKCPLVSICCQTYNHVSYIRDCIEGFLLQKTSFPIEILIHDDASVDGTADIIREYEIKYPKLIYPIYQTENQYSKGARVPSINYRRSKGKYIAFCEGDDYWTDPLKLQKQIEFLESHSEYGVCSHVYRTLENGVFTEIDTSKQRKNKEIKRCIQFNYIEYNRDDNFFAWYTQPLTLVFRKTLLENLPKTEKNMHYNDVSLAYDFLTTSKGAFAFIDAGVYRKHGHGIYTSLTTYEYYIKYRSVYEELYNRNPCDRTLRYMYVKYTMMSFIINKDFKNAAYYSIKTIALNPKESVPFIASIFIRRMKKVIHL